MKKNQGSGAKGGTTNTIGIFQIPIVKSVRFAFMLYIISFFALNGCASFSKTSPESRFYTLETIDKGKSVEKINIPSDIIIGIGPVNIPEYINRPQIVTQNKDKTLNFAQFDRWGEPLDFAIARLISENLRVLLPDAVIETYPWNAAIPVKYRIIIDVIQLVSELEKDMSFVVQWSVIDLHDNKMLLIKKMEISEPIEPDNYEGLVKTLSLGCASLSSQIASGIALIANEPKTE